MDALCQLRELHAALPAWRSVPALSYTPPVSPKGAVSPAEVARTVDALVADLAGVPYEARAAWIEDAVSGTSVYVKFRRDAPPVGGELILCNVRVPPSHQGCGVFTTLVDVLARTWYGLFVANVFNAALARHLLHSPRWLPLDERPYWWVYCSNGGSQ